MEYQKIIKLLGNTPNQLSKSRTKKWIEINDISQEESIIPTVTLDLILKC